MYSILANMVGLDNENVFLEVVHPNGRTIYKGTNNEKVTAITIGLDAPVLEKEKLNYLANRRISVRLSH